MDKKKKSEIRELKIDDKYKINKKKPRSEK